MSIDREQPSMVIARRLRELRESRGLSKRDVAKALQIDYTAYAKYESGARGIKPELLIKLADFFDVSVDYLFGRVERKRDEIVREVRIREGIEMALRAAEIPEQVLLTPLLPDDRGRVPVPIREKFRSRRAVLPLPSAKGCT